MNDRELKAESGWPNATTLVLAAESPEQRRWAVESALEFVRQLAAEHAKAVLVDLHVGDDSPTAILGEVGEKGIVDVFFRGASFSDVARRPEPDSFFFLSIGIAPPPRKVLFNHPGWAKIASRLATTKAYLFPCVPAAEWLKAGPIPGFESCVVLNAGEGEVELPEGAEAIAEFRRPVEVVDEPEPEPEPEAEPEVYGAELEFIEPPSEVRVEPPVPIEAETVGAPVGDADEGGREIVARAEAVPEGEPATEAEPMPAAPGESLAPGEAEAAFAAAYWKDHAHEASRPTAIVGTGDRPGDEKKRSSRRNWGPVFAGLAVVVLVFSLWQAWQDGFFVQEAAVVEGVEPELADDPGIEAAAADQAITVPEPPVTETEASPAPEPEVALPFSVALASFRTMPEALAHQTEHERADILIYIVPTEVQGVLWYRVLAGALPGRAAAEELNRFLVSQGIKGSASEWDVRPAPFAFHLGMYSSPGNARAAVETLRGKGIPAYFVPAPAAGPGQDRTYHVYAGGYGSEPEAEPLRALLAETGMTATLVRRAGLAFPY